MKADLSPDCAAQVMTKLMEIEKAAQQESRKRATTVKYDLVVILRGFFTTTKIQHKSFLVQDNGYSLTYIIQA